MKVIISTDGKYVSQHFGRCPVFTIAKVENGSVISKEEINNPGHQPGFLPKFFAEKNAGVIIAGGMGQRARSLFEQHNIEPILGISGFVTDVLNRYAAGELNGAESFCSSGGGKGYGIDKETCDHGDH